nr:hypothetical protein [Anaerolineae bacterium]
MKDSATYRIVVQGRLEANWEDWFSGMKITTDLSSTRLAVTTLRGEVTDQAALHGILNTLYNLGLLLIEVRLQPSREA